MPHTRRRSAPESHSASSPRGAAQRGIDVTEGGDPRVGHAALGKQGRDVVTGVDARGQGIVFDLDEVARVGGGGAIRRDDDRDRLADVADPVTRQRWLQIGRVSRLAGLAQRNRRHSREIAGGEASQYAGLRERPPRINPADVGVSVGASHTTACTAPGRSRSST
jgi:hypothetical protein